MMLEKVCKDCDIVKPIDNFDKHPKMGDGRINVCKICRHIYCKVWRKRNRDALRLKKAAHHQKVKTEINLAKRVDRKNNPSKYQEANLRHNFGLSLEQYNQMLKIQNGCCAICKLPESAVHQTGVIRNLAVDHCHQTGKIRGLLCGKCNKGIGLFKDSVETIKSAIIYLGGAN